MPTLLEIGIDLYADDSRFNAAMNGIVGRAVGMGGRAGSSFGSSFGVGFSNPMLNAVAGINSAIGGISSVVGFGASLFGMNTAAEFAMYRRQLQGISGDAKTAGKAFDALTDIAGATNFNTDEVFQFGIRQAGKTGDVAGAVESTKNILDAAAAFGVSNQKFGAFQWNMDQIENQRSGKAHVSDVRQLMSYGPIVSTAIAKALGVSVPEATKKIWSASGKDLTAMIQQVGKANEGLARSQAGFDPFTIGANVIDSAKIGSAFTGQILNDIALPIMRVVKGATDMAGALNSSTNGQFGIAAIFAGVTAFRVLYGSSLTAASSVRALASSIQSLSFGGGGRGMTIFPKGSPGASGGIGALGISKGAIIASAVGAVAGMAGGVIGGKIGGLLANMGTGAMMGAQLGGVWGAVGGAALGAVPTLMSSIDDNFGAGKAEQFGAEATKLLSNPLALLFGRNTQFGQKVNSIIDDMWGVQEKDRKKSAFFSQDASDKNQTDKDKALKENTEALKTTSRSIGGGARTAGSLSMVEREFAIYSMARGNAVGVG